MIIEAVNSILISDLELTVAGRMSRQRARGALREEALAGLEFLVTFVSRQK